MNLKQIDKGITKLRGLTKDTNALVQSLAVAIVEHAFGTGEGQGSGDVSRAGKLLQALPNSFRREYLIRWFLNAGIRINPNDNYAAKVVSKDSKGYREPAARLEFAKANTWSDAVDKNGERAPWYQGPTPKEQEPNTMVDFADNILNFVDRTAKNVKEGKLRGTEKPMYTFTDEQRDLVNHALGAVREIGFTLQANVSLEDKKREVSRLADVVKEGLAKLQASPTYEEIVEETETPVAEAVAG